MRPTSCPRSLFWTRTAAMLVLCVTAGCVARIPPARYGVRSLSVEGLENLDPESVKACLATQERSAFRLNLGRGYDPPCGKPPFKGKRLQLKLFTWAWSSWPIYDESVFQRDVDRIKRWFRARGYYDAEVHAVAISPERAETGDRFPAAEPPCKTKQGRGCPADLSVTVSEGAPILVERIQVQGTTELSEELKDKLDDALRLRVGEPFDEELYDTTRRLFTRALAEASFAKGTVSGRVEVDPELRQARVYLELRSGPSFRFGRVYVTGQKHLSVRPILASAYIKEGSPFRASALDEAQREVYGLGAFSSVEVIPHLLEEEEAIADVEIRVAPGRLTRFGLGVGVMAGALSTTTNFQDQTVPQWDVHLLAIAEHRNFLGGLRRIRIEERPRLIFDQVFPQTGGSFPSPGNLAMIEFRQPAFLEQRTQLYANVRWDLGPDPFQARFFRHDLDARLAPQRTFFGGRLSVSVGIHANWLFVTEVRDRAPADYFLMFWEQNLSLDLRDNPTYPTRGFYATLGLHQAGYGLPASWRYFRTTPDTRFYIPLPYELVLAGRFALGMLFIQDSDEDLDALSSQLGPERYRLRGGGASGNRGFVPGDLGDGIEGGLRRWEASLELRAMLTEAFGTVIFTDLGDVHRGSTFRFDHLNTSVGFGFRYLTPVGPLRADLGFLVDRARIIGEEAPTSNYLVNLGFVQFPGAFHLTIGNAF